MVHTWCIDKWIHLACLYWYESRIVDSEPYRGPAAERMIDLAVCKTIIRDRWGLWATGEQKLPVAGGTWGQSCSASSFSRDTQMPNFVITSFHFKPLPQICYDKVQEMGLHLIHSDKVFCKRVSFIAQGLAEHGKQLINFNSYWIITAYPQIIVYVSAIHSVYYFLKFLTTS